MPSVIASTRCDQNSMRLGLLAERLEVVVHHVEVARLVVHLARGGELRLERHERVGELRADLPRRELAPHDDGEDLREGACASRAGASACRACAMSSARTSRPSQMRAWPDVVDALHPARAARLGVGARTVEHVEGQLAATQEQAAHGGQAHAASLPQACSGFIRRAR